MIDFITIQLARYSVLKVIWGVGWGGFSNIFLELSSAVKIVIVIFIVVAIARWLACCAGNPVQFSSVRVKMVSTRSGKPKSLLPHLQ